jgi:lysine-specific demethylase 8
MKRIIKSSSSLSSLSSFSFSSSSLPILTKCKIITFDSNLSSNDFDWKNVYDKQEPIIFRNLINDWNALQRWRDGSSYFKPLLNCLNEEDRIVPVEYGGNYMDSNMQLIHVDFLQLIEFFEKPIDIEKPLPPLYLAQFDINQIKLLLNDVSPPPLLSTSTGKNIGKGDIYRINLWIGKNTSSPCHFDPFQNMLCQIIGNKQVILFPQSSSSNLYPAIGTVQKNTSLVNFDNPDLIKHSMFPTIKNGIIANLEPGDALFIPLKWWHYCSSKDFSTSVNYWWL